MLKRRLNHSLYLLTLLGSTLTACGDDDSPLVVPGDAGGDADVSVSSDDSTGATTLSSSSGPVAASTDDTAASTDDTATSTDDTATSTDDTATSTDDTAASTDDTSAVMATTSGEDTVSSTGEAPTTGDVTPTSSSDEPTATSESSYTTSTVPSSSGEFSTSEEISETFASSTATSGSSATEGSSPPGATSTPSATSAAEGSSSAAEASTDGETTGAEGSTDVDASAPDDTSTDDGLPTFGEISTNADTSAEMTGGGGITADNLDAGVPDASTTDAGTWELTSPAFTDGEAMPYAYTCDAGDFASGGFPGLDWTAGPSGTLSYALLFVDTTVRDGNDPSSAVAAYNRAFHWAIWDIPADVQSLTTALGDDDDEFPTTVPGARQWTVRSQFGFFPPCPNSSGTRTANDQYAFILYALNTEIFDYPEYSSDLTMFNYTRTLYDALESSDAVLAKIQINASSDALSETPPEPRVTLPPSARTANDQ